MDLQVRSLGTKAPASPPSHTVALGYVARLALCAALSSLALSLLIYMNRTSTGDITGKFNDHLHHTHATWAFLVRGMSVYSVPFGELTKTFS